MIGTDDVRWPEDGLVAGVVQDAGDGRVLMVGWLDREALTATLATGVVHFHSRSRDRLWRKGETSGNELALVDVTADCDADALLLTARPTGPTCHTGARSCFDDAASAAPPLREEGFAWLEELWRTIAERAAERPEGSYTARLLAGGVDAVARKVAEEATEVVMAAKDHAVDLDSANAASGLASEMADLLYHLLVLGAERGVPPSAFISTLRERHAGRGA